jgi:DUF1365 family protein
MTTIEHIAGQTYHGRRGPVNNRFTYAVDYVLFDAEASLTTPRLLSRNARNLASLWDRDHGGAPGQGRGAAWVRDVLAAHDMADVTDGKLLLLTQPRVLGHLFNPVSFWLCHDAAGDLRAMVAEVNNTYGDRHSYLCAKPDRSAIGPKDELQARKIFYVSPFQPVEGEYTFHVDVTVSAVNIRIGYRQDAEAENAGLVATLTGTRQTLRNRAILWAMARRMGSRRVLALIHWQALKLWWKGARFNTRPAPPVEEISR